MNFSWQSREGRIDEIGQNPLLPMRQNRRGPGLAVGEINAGGRDEVVLGGTPADPARLLLAGTTTRFASDDAAPATAARHAAEKGRAALAVSEAPVAGGGARGA